jgi:hypothetical protein
LREPVFSRLRTTWPSKTTKNDFCKIPDGILSPHFINR